MLYKIYNINCTNYFHKRLEQELKEQKSKIQIKMNIEQPNLYYQGIFKNGIVKINIVEKYSITNTNEMNLLFRIKVRVTERKLFNSLL